MILFILAVLAFILLFFAVRSRRNSYRRMIKMHGGKVKAGQSFLFGDIDYVFDGDTVKVISGSEQIRVRLLHVDAPESNQSRGGQATAMLKSLINGSPVMVVHSGYDRYNRLLGEIYTDRYRQSINLLMVEAGLAWVYRGCRDKHYHAAQAQAKKHRIGLWSDSNAINPAVWRQAMARNQLPFWHRLF